MNDTHRLGLIEMVNEAGFYGHATQRHAHQQDQQGLCHPRTPLALFQPGWYWRPVDMAVHHIHRGIPVLGHTYSALSVTERRFSVEIFSRSCQRVLLQGDLGDKKRLERQRSVKKSRMGGLTCGWLKLRWLTSSHIEKQTQIQKS